MNNIKLYLKDKDGNDFQSISLDTEKMIHAVMDHSYPREIIKIMHDRLVYLAYEKKYQDLRGDPSGMIIRSARDQQLSAEKELKEFLNLLVELK